MSNHHLRNMELSLKAKGLMSLMLSLPPSWDYSIGGLVSICKESHTSIRSALKELEDNMYLIRKRVNNEKGHFSYEYNLYEIPFLPHTENQHTVQEHAEKGHTENRRQLSKEELNTDKLNTESIYIENVLNEIQDWELRELYEDYLEMREVIESPLSAKGLIRLIQRNERLSNGDIALQRSLLEAAIINKWKSVYLPNEQDIENNNTKAERKRFYNL